MKVDIHGMNMQKMLPSLFGRNARIYTHVHVHIYITHDNLALVDIFSVNALWKYVSLCRNTVTAKLYPKAK